MIVEHLISLSAAKNPGVVRRFRRWRVAPSVIAGAAWIIGAVLWLYAGTVAGDLRSSPGWYDPNWHYRVPVTIPAGTPVNSTIRVDIDFGLVLGQLGKLGISGTFDGNSPRVVRSSGALATNQEFTDTIYLNATDAAGNGTGEVRFLLEDAGPATYYIYFDIIENGAKAANPQTPINGGFEFGGAGAQSPPGWTASKANVNFDAQVRPSETLNVTTNNDGNAALPSATVSTDGTPFRGAFSYLLGGRSNTEAVDANPAVTLDKTIAVPASCASGLTLRYRVEGWDSSINGGAQWDFLRIRLIGGTTAELVGPATGNYTTLPFSPNLGFGAASAGASGYRQFNGWDTDTNGTHRSGMSVARGSQPWWTVTNNLAGFLGQTITLRFTSTNATFFRSWHHIDQVEWCVVDGTLGVPEGFGANITAPTGATTYAVGQTLSVTAQADAQPTAAVSPVVAYVYDPSAILKAGPVNLPAGGGGFTNAAVYTFLATDTPGTWTVRVYAKDASTSTVGATNGLVHIPLQPAAEIQANYYNIDEQTFTLLGQPGGFNAYDTGTTPAGATTGKIFTKVAGIMVSLDIIALNLAKNAILTTFTGTVKVELLNSSNNTGALDGNGCRPTWTVIPTPLANLTFALGDNGRKTISFTEPNAYPDARMRITYPASGASTAIGCSNDNFAIRPASFSVSVTDANRTTAGPTNALNVTTLPAGTGIVHNAGRPFTITATALNGAGAPVVTSNYGSPPIVPTPPTVPPNHPPNPIPVLTACAGSACTVTSGALTPGAWVAGGGTVTTSTASYDDVGAFNMQLQDSAFAAVDAADGTPATCSNTAPMGSIICSVIAGVGRFVPDRFVLSATSLTPRSDIAACAGSSFTYMSERMDANFTLTAVNAAGSSTTRYFGSLARLALNSPASFNFGAIDSVAPTPLTARVDTSLIASIPATWTAGVAVVGAPIAISRALSPDGPYSSVKIGFAPSDPDAVVLDPAFINLDADNNGSSERAQIGLATGVRFGRLRLQNANGSQLIAMPIPMQAQYWNGTGFVTNTLDNCTTIVLNNVAKGNPMPLGFTVGAPVVGGAFSAGVGSLQLPKPAGGARGSVDVSVNLTNGSAGASCTAGMPASTGANKAYLQGLWCTPPGTYASDPTARATFGVYKGADRFIYQRENY